MRNPEKNLDLMETPFLVKPVKGTIINKNVFPLSNEPYTAKQSLVI